MTRARTTIRTVGLLGAAALVAAGCGGSAPPATTGATPAPGTDPNAPTVGDPGADPNAAGAVDPATGLPVDPNAAAAGAGATTASVPDLSGDDVAGGLGSSESSPLFLPGAIDTDKADELFKASEKAAEDASSSTGSTTTTPGTDVEKTPAVTYSGAKIYVDGIVHDVNVNGAFPKGNPVFRLLSVTANDIEIELIAGEFTSGGGVGTVLDKGELVSLVNSSEQLTYRIKFLRGIASTDTIGF